MKKHFRLFIILVLLAAGCGEVKELLKKSTPYEEYTESLYKAGLDKTEIGTSWINAGRTALLDTLFISLPFREAGYFFSYKTEASSYRFSAKRGEKLIFKINNDTAKHALLFADLFTIDNSGKAKAAASLEKNSKSFSYLVENDAEFLLRLQPELLKGGSYEIIITKNPSLAFPIPGKNSNLIGSFWGNPRDGGKRKHEGVDIFAPKGTPVIAACDGIISRTGENNLGGKVVWLTSTDGFSLYYAHLDSQIVSPGKIVSTGDTLGLVGNTGNARFTDSHLHFGIYYFGEGAVDPYPFVKDNYPDPSQIKSNISLLGEQARIKMKSSLLNGIRTESEKIKLLNKGMPVSIYGAVNNFYKIKTPDGVTGYVLSTEIENLRIPLNEKKFFKGIPIVDTPALNADIITTLDNDEHLSIYGEYNNYYFIQFRTNYGWIKKS